MPRGRGTLAQLERQLAQINGEREKVIAAIRSAVERLTAGSAANVGALYARAAGVANRIRPKRKISVAGRRRLSRLAKARWAKAKKAGLTRLG